MKEVEQSVSKIMYLESADGEYRYYVGNIDKSNSDAWDVARKKVMEYEDSARGALGQIVMAIPHFKINADDQAAYYYMQDSGMCSDSKVYFFKVSTESEMESLVKWMKLQYPDEEISVTLKEPFLGKHKETKDGKEVEVNNTYLTCYDRSYEPAIDLKRYVGHTVVVVDCYEYKMYLEGTLEEIEARHQAKLKFFKESLLPKELQ